MQRELLIAKTEKKIYDVLPHEPETMATTLFVIGMAAYYMWRMFVITPQHEELVTFYHFISNGPLYSALNWPSPNNHIGYSVLASVMNYFGNNYIGLRGISYICAVSNLILVYRICKKFFAHALPFAAVVLYASMQVVNEYSIQGRGYTLATFCFLLAVYAATDMCRAVEARNYRYITFIICIIYGVYTTPSSIYWAVPVCLTTVVFLFINGFRSRKFFESDAENIYFKKLNSVITAIGVSFFGTLILYTIIWFMVGAKRLVGDSRSAFYETSDGLVLLRNPIKALGTGMSFMYMQRQQDYGRVDLFKEQFLSWIVDLLNYMLPGFWVVLLIFLVSGVAIMIAECIRHFEYSRTVVNLMAIINIFFVVLVLIATHNLPSLRGFGYGSFFMTLCVISCFEKLINVTIRFYNRAVSGKGLFVKHSEKHNETENVTRTGKWYDGLGVYTPVVVIMLLFIARLFGSTFNSQVGIRENDIFNTMYIANISAKKTPCVLDEDQEYLLKFGFDLECDKRDVTGADVVILDRNMMEEGYSGQYLSRFYQTYETIDWEYLSTMHIQYENDSIILYTK
ncbi:glycosyltransferase family 39 protein [Butyrivibrio sp. INlla14]|uniref:glycosyltransferase family 39 protein n=1 Tax=Butyrivibrio sp. INlla14 TaxID=1520808 RepID=UPI000876E239|nr:glycosyltransferase family 39 protein [Butyrivibrio sp. INlla14]SCY30204.1 Dolichyl-phosphate-mannose-protein mannosyltransferase [Butyrivibrio sp. INlla14]